MASSTDGSTGGSTLWPLKRATAGLQILLLLGLVGGLAGGAALSCVVNDSDYCATSLQCPFTASDLGSDMGMVQLTCHPTRHTCILPDPNNCSADSDCTDAKASRCDPTTNKCIGCTVGDQTDKSCGNKICALAADGSGATECVACQTNLDCPMTAPICDSQQCRACTTHRDCEGALNCDNGTRCTDSLVCIQDGDLTSDLTGRCAQNGSGATGRVIYVNNQVTCSGSFDGSSFSTPLCSNDHNVNLLDNALALASTQNRRFIRIVGDYPAPNTVVMSGAYSFIGAPAKTYTAMATIESHGTLFSVQGTGSVTLDQLNMTEQSMDGQGLALSCQGATSGTPPSFTMRRSILAGGTMPNSQHITAAINLANCNVILDGNVIGVTNMADVSNPTASVHGDVISIIDANGGSGLTSYLIQNNIIAGNAGIALNLTATKSSTAKFIIRFNTIVGNGRSTVGTYPGAVACSFGSGLQEFSYSIVMGNATAMGSQFLNTYCPIKNVVVGSTGESGTQAGLVKVDAALDAMFRMQSNTSNLACCIDQVSPGVGETLPSRDVDGLKRPTGTKWDIGASELKP